MVVLVEAEAVVVVLAKAAKADREARAQKVSQTWKQKHGQKHTRHEHD
jgi:hypothetical protein